MMDSGIVFVLKLLFHHIVLRQDRLCPIVDILGLLRRVQSLVEPFEKTYAVVALNLLYCSGDGRLGHVEILRRTGHVEGLADFDEDPHVVVGHGTLLDITDMLSKQ